MGQRAQEEPSMTPLLESAPAANTTNRREPIARTSLIPHMMTATTTAPEKAKAIEEDRKPRPPPLQLHFSRKSVVIRARRRCFEAIMLWELVLRGFFVELPKVLYARLASLEKMIAFFVVYVMLQALAILWGFLFNVGAILSENMTTIIMMPFIRAVCVLFIYVSVMGIVLSFGRTTWILTWQSLENFPLIRRIIAIECRPQAVIITVAIPLLAILPSLILVPPACSAATAEESWMKIICEESYLKFLSDKHPVFQRALRLSMAITIAQFIQLCLEILPHWRCSLSGLSTASTFFLGGWLLLMNFLGAIWAVEWVARHFAYKITPLSNLSLLHWEVVGMALLMMWILWFLAVTYHTFANVKECEPSQKGLIGFFERVKFTFVFGQAIIFLRACFHPSMGFVHAQLELTIINLLLPSIYVISLMMLRMVCSFTIKSISISVPLALGLGALIFQGSDMTEKPHSLFIVSLFLFDTFLRWSSTVSSLSRIHRLPYLLQQASTKTKKPLAGHNTAKKMVVVALLLLLAFIGVLSAFSILAVLQKSAHWFPDATSIAYDENSMHIQHTAIVKLHLGLTNDTSKSMSLNQPKYSSCSNRWNGLGLVDLALFAEAAYFDPESNDILQFISTIFGNNMDVINIKLPELNTKTGSKIDFFEAYIPSLNTSVISVRGTDIWRFTDFIEDAKMYFEPVVFAVLSTIFPTIRIWPDVTFSTLIELYSELVSLCGIQHESWYYHELLEYVNSIKDRDVVLTGHSMGGGIARLVGSVLGKTSITFSPPGIVQSYSKLVHHVGGQSMKVERANLHHQSVAVIPEYDPVTLIDAQAGMIQKISCDTPHLSMQLSCHMLEGTLCNLLEHCGDTTGRISSCRFQHKITSITENLLPKLAIVCSPSTVVPVVVTFAIMLSTLLRRRRLSSPPPSPVLHRRRKSKSPTGNRVRSRGRSRPQHSSSRQRRSSIT